MLEKETKNRFSNESIAAKSPLRAVGLALTNSSLAALFIFFAIANGRSFLENPRLSVFLIVLTETIVAIFLIIRRDPEETGHSWPMWISTTCGTLAPFLLRPVEGTEDLVSGGMLQVIGFAIQIVALLSLNKSLGLLPAYRGIKSGGLYGWVRHPLYSAYVITFLGYWMNNQSVYNAAVVLGGTAFLIMRIHYEEALLRKYDDYTRYATRIRWRLIPAIW